MSEQVRRLEGKNREQVDRADELAGDLRVYKSKVEELTAKIPPVVIKMDAQVQTPTTMLDDLVQERMPKISARQASSQNVMRQGSSQNVINSTNSQRGATGSRVGGGGKVSRPPRRQGSNVNRGKLNS